MEIVAALRDLVGRTPGLDAAIGRILDRRDRDGRMPRRITLEAPEAVGDALATVFSRRAVAALGDGRVRVDLALAARQLGEGGERRLQEVLLDATGRSARDLAAEDRTLRSALAARIDTALGSARTDAARAYLAAERAAVGAGRGGAIVEARERGLETAAREITLVARAVDAVVENEAPVRIQAFAARALGSSKALPGGSDRLRRVCAALWDHHPWTRERIQELGDFATLAGAQAEALDVHGIYRDVAAASALCFGPLVYRKGVERFDHVARHAARGECSRLVQHQLRDADLGRPEFDRVTLIENLTPFLDGADALSACGEHRELLVHTGGHASWAVIALLRLIAPFGIPVRHAGDLDRSGVVIARDIRRRTGMALTLLHMDAATHERFRAHGKRIGPGERERLRIMLDTGAPDGLGRDLLEALHGTGTWIEQEVFSDETLAELTHRYDTGKTPDGAPF